MPDPAQPPPATPGEPAPDLPPGLRQRTRAAVRAQIARTACALFAERGFDATTVDEVAAAAGLSRRSFFRYFASKEDAVVGLLDDTGDAIARELAARPAAEPPWTALRHAIGTALAPFEADPGQALALFRLIESTPALRAGHVDKQDHWQRPMTAVLAARLGVDPAADLRPELLTIAAIGALDVATRRWVAAAGTVDFAGVLDTAFAVLGAGMGDASPA